MKKKISRICRTGTIDNIILFRLSLLLGLTVLSMCIMPAVCLTILLVSLRNLSNGWVIMKPKECRSRQSWPNLRHCSGICLEELRKTKKNLKKEVGASGEIRIGQPHNSSHKLYHLGQLLQHTNSYSRH